MSFRTYLLLNDYLIYEFLYIIRLGSEWLHSSLFNDYIIYEWKTTLVMTCMYLFLLFYYNGTLLYHDALRSPYIYITNTLNK